LEEYDNAVKNYMEAIERRQHSNNDLQTDGELASFHYYAGLCLFELKRFKEAITNSKSPKIFT